MTDEKPKRRLVDIDTPTNLLPLLPADASQYRPGRYRDEAGRTYVIGAVFDGNEGQWYYETDEEYLSDE